MSDQTTSKHPHVRSTARTIVAVLVAAAGVIALLTFFAARDRSGVTVDRGPGTAFPDQGAAHIRPGARKPPYNSVPPTSGPHVAARLAREATALSNDQILEALEKGNVVLLYGPPSVPRALRALVDRLDVRFSPSLAALGEAVILGRHGPRAGVTALAWRHKLEVDAPTDPNLSVFIDFWLGRGAKHQPR